MRFTTIERQKAVGRIRASTVVPNRAIGDNYAFEEQVSDKRLVDFEDFADDGEFPDDLGKCHQDYYDERCREGRIAASFDRSTHPAALMEPERNQFVVRLEDIGWVLRENGHDRDLALIETAWREGDSAFVEKFLDQWNGGSDIRPRFATFHDAVTEDAEHDDWPHRLRERLGLAHLNPKERPIPVALMVYKVGDVLDQCPDGAVAFTTPTVLDSKPSPYFFPAPKEACYGRAMPLSDEGDDDSLQPEILHTPIRYKPEHIRALGWIDRPVAQTPDLKVLRNHHLLCVRLATGRDDFGEEMT